MPCTREGHNHQWFTEGTLLIERCEKQCQWCVYKAGEYNVKGSSGNYPCALRRHVAQKHAKHFPNLVVGKWTKSPTGNKKSDKKAKSPNGTTPAGATGKGRKNQGGNGAGVAEMGGYGDAAAMDMAAMPPQTQLLLPEFQPDFFPETQIALPAAPVDQNIDPAMLVDGHDFSFAGLDISGSISTASPEGDGSLPRWSPPQTVRTNGIPIVGLEPMNRPAASLLGDGVNELVKVSRVNLTNGEIVCVLETYTEMLKKGLVGP